MWFSFSRNAQLSGIFGTHYRFRKHHLFGHGPATFILLIFPPAVLLDDIYSFRFLYLLLQFSEFAQRLRTELGGVLLISGCVHSE